MTTGCRLAKERGLLPTDNQARNIFTISRLPDAQGAQITQEGRELAADMYFTAIERDKGMVWIERVFRSWFAPSVPSLGKTMVVDTLNKEAQGLFQVGEHKSLELRYSSTGAAIVHQVGATHKPRYMEEVLRTP